MKFTIAKTVKKWAYDLQKQLDELPDFARYENAKKIVGDIHNLQIKNGRVPRQGV